jgi:hypothetical protein
MKYHLDPEQSTAGRRAAAYWFEDGLPEIVVGVPLILMSVAGVLLRLYLDLWIRVFYVAAAACFFVVVVFHRHVLDLLKAHITYPRTGYVRPPTLPPAPDPDQVLGLHLDRPAAPASNQNVTRFPFVIVMTFGVMPILAGSYGLGGAWSLPAAMVVISGLIYVFQHDSEHEYSLWSVLPLAASGFLPFVIGTPDRILRFLPWLFGGIWLLVRGAWTLTRYLHRHPRPQVMEQLPK